MLFTFDFSRNFAELHIDNNTCTEYMGLVIYQTHL